MLLKDEENRGTKEQQEREEIEDWKEVADTQKILRRKVKTQGEFCFSDKQLRHTSVSSAALKLQM